MEFRLLGPLEVLDQEGRPLRLGGAKQRTLLALLVLHANSAVSIDRLTDELWGETPPSSASTMLHGHISKLRKLLEPGGSAPEMLVTSAGGYELRVEPGHVDAARFGLLVDEGARALDAAQPGLAERKLREALGLFRGPPLADLSFEPALQPAIAHLESLRVAALIQRIEAQLALSRHAELVPELEALVRDRPLDERLRAHLMLALYRCGRQADALAAYQDARRMLVSELGIEPGAELRDLQAAILGHEAAIAAPPRPRRWTGRAGSKLVASAAVVALAAVGAGVALLALTGGTHGAAIAPVGTRNFVAIVDGKTHRIVHRIPFSGDPSHVVIGDGNAWVGDEDDRTVSRIDLRLRAIQRIIGVGVKPTDLAIGAGAVWALDFGARTLVRIDPHLDFDATRRFRLQLGPKPEFSLDPSGIAAGAGAVWLENGESRLFRIDPASGTIVRSLKLGTGLDAVAVGRETVWVTRRTPPSLLRIDPRTTRLAATIPIAAPKGVPAPYPLELAVGFGSVWVLDDNTGLLTRVDPALGAVVATLRVAKQPTHLAVGEGAVWVVDGGTASLVEIDPAGYRVVSTLPIGGAAGHLAAGGGAVWVPAHHF